MSCRNEYTPWPDTVDVRDQLSFSGDSKNRRGRLLRWRPAYRASALSLSYRRIVHNPWRTKRQIDNRYPNILRACDRPVARPTLKRPPSKTMTSSYFTYKTHTCIYIFVTIKCTKVKPRTLIYVNLHGIIIMHINDRYLQIHAIFMYNNISYKMWVNVRSSSMRVKYIIY